MDLVIKKKKKHHLSLMMPVTVLLLTIGLSLVMIDHTSLCFVLPLLLVSYSSGIIYLMMYALGIIFASFIVENGLITLYISAGMCVLIYLMSYFHFMKSQYLPVILSAVVVGVLTVYQFTYVQILILTLLTLVNCYLYMQLIPIIIHNHIDAYSYHRFIIISILVLTLILSLYPLSTTYMMILMRYYLLLATFYLTIQNTMTSLLYISIVMMLISPQFQDDVLALLLPMSFYFMYQPKNKYLFISMYFVGHIIVPFFITYQYTYYAFIIVVSAFLFFISPQLKIRQLHVSRDFHETTKQNQLVAKANAFSSLFKQLMDVFMEDNHQQHLGEYVGYIYEDVCNQCSSKDYCFYHHDGMNRLGKLMVKGMKDHLSKDDRSYIHQHCLNPDCYLESLQRYQQGYQKMMKMNHVHQEMKKNLFQEFSLIGDVFESFSHSLEYHRHQDEDLLKQHLQAYQFHIVYLKKRQLDDISYTLELGIEDINEQCVLEELIPILESYLNQTLQVQSLQDHRHHLGYTSLILKHQLMYQVAYGVQQFSLDHRYCGDSYCSFIHDFHHYIALSDGMGQGEVAYKESHLTLQVLSQLIHNDIGLSHTLNTLNALLKIKNQGDMYTTLDLCDFDLSSARLKIVKYGAYASYIVRNQNIEVVETKSLPVGMASQMKMCSYEMKLEDQDLIILVSDGVKEQIPILLKSHLHHLDCLHPTEIASLLMSEILDQHHLDDITILALRVTKTNSFVQ